MGKAIRYIDRKLYPTSGRGWDEQALAERVLRRLRTGMLVLDLGAGAGIVEDVNLQERATVHGIDLDPRVKDNPGLHAAVMGDASALPFRDESYDLVLADNLLEHLIHPEMVFAEVTRVLKRDGSFLVKTPNRYHYVTLISRLTNQRFHRWVVSLRGRKSEDTFRTLYRANSTKELRMLATKTGLVVEDIDLIEGRPEYCRIFPPLYVLGALYERIVNATSLFSTFRILLIGDFRKPALSEGVRAGRLSQSPRSVRSRPAGP